uniref:Transposon protein, putative, CACTA, En/Spm sub-class n=1 Tax=Oryza sativa subsp. japonica TaxID=39947 RepID=Q2QU70_ORYSJ|nr:transposon protein, putative, CACTA, En/Spm sub-class [Oryza sativa Japonica Group]
MVAGGGHRHGGAAAERGEGKGETKRRSTAHPGSTATTETATGAEEGGGAARVDRVDGAPAVGDRNGEVDEVGEDAAKAKEAAPRWEVVRGDDGGGPELGGDGGERERRRELDSGGERGRLEALQNNVVQCLVSLELIFSLSFFNIMMHLLCHLVKEISILGPVYLHNMFPFKRYMGVLKKYVRNRARPEASIAKGYGTEEVIEFCVEFIEDLRPIGVPESRHEGRLRGKGTLGRKAIMTGYEINGYTFYTRAQDMKSTNQNNVVRIDAMGHNGTTGTYYGAIEDIWELDYGSLKVPLFRCQWVRLTGGAEMIDDSGMTTVDLNKVGYSDEPFVLANDVMQVFYVKDLSSKGKKGRGPDEPKRHVVLPGKRKIVGVEDKTDEDYDQFDGQPPFMVTIDPSILLSNKDTPYSSSDHKEGTIVRRKYVRSTVTADVLL